MSQVSDYMLGRCFSLLVQLRGYLIMKEDTDGISLIENEYQELKADMNEHYYGHLKGKSHDQSGS
jgi:hypothetical protein